MPRAKTTRGLPHTVSRLIGGAARRDARSLWVPGAITGSCKAVAPSPPLAASLELTSPTASRHLPAKLRSQANSLKLEARRLLENHLLAYPCYFLSAGSCPRQRQLVACMQQGASWLVLAGTIQYVICQLAVVAGTLEQSGVSGAWRNVKHSTSWWYCGRPPHSRQILLPCIAKSVQVSCRLRRPSLRKKMPHKSKPRE